MTLFDKLAENLEDKEEITRTLLEFDHMLELLHNNGFCIYDFDPKKITLYDNKFKFNSFDSVLNDIGISQNMKEINIYQLSKMGLMCYNNKIVDGKMNQEHFDFIQKNLEKFNEKGMIPSEIYEYYEEIFRRLNVCYMNDYLIQKKQEVNGAQNSNVMRKSLSTEIGRAYANEDNTAFVNILFIPTIITLLYLIGLMIYVFVIK